MYFLADDSPTPEAAASAASAASVAARRRVNSTRSRVCFGASRVGNAFVTSHLADVWTTWMFT